jgi:ABC-2 type transport system ATP-binding protein
LVADLERVCDYLIVLTTGHVQVSGEVEELLATHYRLCGARREVSEMPTGMQVVDASHTDRQSTFVVRSAVPIDDPSWTVEQLTMEDIVLAYMTQAAAAEGRDRILEVSR